MGLRSFQCIKDTSVRDRHDSIREIHSSSRFESVRSQSFYTGIRGVF